MNKVSQNLLAASRPLSGFFIYTIRNESERAMCPGRETAGKPHKALRALRRAFILVEKGGRDGI